MTNASSMISLTNIVFHLFTPESRCARNNETGTQLVFARLIGPLLLRSVFGPDCMLQTQPPRHALRPRVSAQRLAARDARLHTLNLPRRQRLVHTLQPVARPIQAIRTTPPQAPRDGACGASLMAPSASICIHLWRIFHARLAIVGR